MYMHIYRIPIPLDSRATSPALLPMNRHIIPIGDTGPYDGVHFAQESCWCYPLVEDDGVVIHNAHDCREKDERRGIVKESKGWVNILEDT